MRLIFRIGIIILCSLITGICINVIYSQGIHIRQLMLVFPGSYRCDFKTLEPDSALELMSEQSAVFFDIRPERQFEIDHISGAVSISARTYMHKPVISSNISRDIPWIFYDYQDNSKNVKLIVRMVKEKYKGEIFVLKGGYASWLIHEFPYEVGNGPDS